MSLINEALKKTQQARASTQSSESLMGAPGGQSAPAPQKSSPWPWIFGIVCLIVVAIPVCILLLRPAAEPAIEEAPTPGPVASAAPEQPTLETPAPAPSSLPEPAATTPAPEPAPLPEPVAQLAPAPEPTPLPATLEPAQAPPAPAPIAQTQKPAEKSATISANEGIVELLKTIKVTGLLLSNDPAESKILLDGEVYSVNGIVDYQLGCRIAEIKKNAVVFTDESGVRYTKRF